MYPKPEHKLMEDGTVASRAYSNRSSYAVMAIIVLLVTCAALLFSILMVLINNKTYLKESFEMENKGKITKRGIELAKQCSDGWDYFNKTDSCYKVYDNKTWHDAEKKCVSESAHLVSIHSEAENFFVYKLVASGTSQDHLGHTWIGLKLDEGAEDHRNGWFWTDESEVDYINWGLVAGEGEPNNWGGNEFCGGMFTDVCSDQTCIPSKWNDKTCSKAQRVFVCKKGA